MNSETLTDLPRTQIEKKNRIYVIKSRILSEEIADKHQSLIDFLKTNPIHPFDNPSYIIVWSVHKIFIGIYDKNEKILPDSEDLHLDELLELRLFNPFSELHLWKWNQQFHYRIRSDDDFGQETYVYNEHHLIWGTQSSNSQALEEPHRGMRLLFPVMIPERDLPLKYIVQNYFKFDSDGLLSFFDARLTNFITQQGGNLNVI